VDAITRQPPAQCIRRRVPRQLEAYCEPPPAKVNRTAAKSEKILEIERETY
jgi:hypothetical protein